MKNPNDHPWLEVAADVEVLANAGALCFQKWTCAGCGERVTANNPNIFTKMGHHDDCGHDTNIVESGCNYVLMAPLTPEFQAVWQAMGKAAAMSTPDRKGMH